MHVSASSKGRVKRALDTGSLGTEVTVGCEPPDMGAGNGTLNS